MIWRANSNFLKNFVDAALGETPIGENTVEPRRLVDQGATGATPRLCMGRRIRLTLEDAHAEPWACQPNGG